MKIGRNEFDINENDVILDNGACYQLASRTITKGWSSYSPVIGKTQFNKLLKLGIVYTNDELKDEAVKRYKHSSVTFWKFDIEKLNKSE